MPQDCGEPLTASRPDKILQSRLKRLCGAVHARWYRDYGKRAVAGWNSAALPVSDVGCELYATTSTTCQMFHPITDMERERAYASHAYGHVRLERLHRRCGGKELDHSR
jgi:hypothetical protein